MRELGVVEAPRVVGRAAHDARGALLAQRLVAAQGARRVFGAGGQAMRQHHAVFDGHHGALRQEGQRGVAGIAQQRGAAFAPRGHGLATQQGPLVGLVNRANDALHVLMPTLEVLQAVLDSAPAVPGLVRPVAALDHADEVDQFAAAHRVGDDVRARADPIGAHGRGQVFGQVCRRHQTTPGHAAGEPGRAGAKQLRATGGMDAVGADQRIEARRRHALDVQPHAGIALMQPPEPGAQVNRIGLERAHRLHQHAVQVGAVQHQIGKSVALDRALTQVEQGPSLSRAPQADLLARRHAGHRAQGRLQAQAEQAARAIGAHLDARAHLAEAAGLLEHIDVDARAQQGERRRQTADACTNHRHLACLRHARLSLNRSPLQGKTFSK